MGEATEVAGGILTHGLQNSIQLPNHLSIFAYPYPAQAQEAAYTAPPPPAGYPTRDVQAANPTADPAPAPGKTTSRGDGFWKGCCAALCCCGLLECCF
ncbi:hypothetical protein ACH5RR_036851 [Cinchona calisaya]|uniref:Cysteine-rich transmembrane domain-containing protein n=1 Tax=Cinchona calisaya TaxID=153742 RepID=A0ABD2Y7J2_9GENT